MLEAQMPCPLIANADAIRVTRLDRCGRPVCGEDNGYDIELNFFSVSPEFIEITTGNPVVYGFDGKPIGYDDCSLKCDSGFALELWAEVLGEDVCDSDGGEGAWIYFLLPWVTNGMLGDLEIGNEAVSLTLNGATRAGGGWGRCRFSFPMATAEGLTCGSFDVSSGGWAQCVS
ncbi:hypothetical protein [Streptomyces nigrescens]|uniref:hypothetical protein n=1 Tax=Streptomyces nigrescens TaxID=1920 RepID=UPI0036B3FBF9